MTDSRISQFNKYVEDKRKEFANLDLARTIRSFSEFTSWSKQIITPEGINEKIVVRDFESLKESLRELWSAFHSFFNPSPFTDPFVTLEVRKSPTAREYCTAALRDVFYISQAFTPSNAIKEEETRQFVIACRKGFVELLGHDWADKSNGSEEATYLNSFFWGTDRNDSIKSLFELCMSHRGVSKLVDGFKSSNSMVSKWLTRRSGVLGNWFAEAAIAVIQRDAGAIVSRYVERALLQNTDAYECIEKALVINPSCREAQACQYLLKKNFKHAVALSRTLVEQTNSRQSIECFCLAVAGRVNELLADSKHREALVLVEEGLRRCPTNTTLLMLKLTALKSTPSRIPGTLPQLP